MARGQRSEFDARRRPLGKPRPTPYFQLGDSAHAVARDWSQGNETPLGLFASSGTVSQGAFDEVDAHLNRGDTDPREKERLTNLRKHLEIQAENQQ